MLCKPFVLWQDNDYVELFAGSGEVSAALRQAGQHGYMLTQSI